MANLNGLSRVLTQHSAKFTAQNRVRITMTWLKKSRERLVHSPVWLFIYLHNYEYYHEHDHEYPRQNQTYLAAFFLVHGHIYLVAAGWTIPVLFQEGITPPTVDFFRSWIFHTPRAAFALGFALRGRFL